MVVGGGGGGGVGGVSALKYEGEVFRSWYYFFTLNLFHPKWFVSAAIEDANKQPRN